MTQATTDTFSRTVFDFVLDYFKKPTADVLAARELEDAKCYLLRHQSAAEYNQKMADYYSTVIRRLNRN